MKKRLHGVHVPHLKNTSQMPAVRIDVPKTVIIPMQMHIGAPAKPLVKPGDAVCVGQKIGEAGGFVSAPIHSGVSGTVKKIGEMTAANGRKMQTVIIETDGLQTPYEGICPPEIASLQDFLNALRESGIVGLGGAGFPTSVKLTLKDPSMLKAVIINCAECEPYITSDTRTLLDRSDDVMEGARLLQKYLNPPRIIFGIEDNKPECIALYRKLTAAEQNMEVHALKAMYPQGGEKVLIYNTIGGVVPEGGLPIDAGAVVLNCTTLAGIAAYIRTGMPLTEKCITVDGSAVREPKNVIVPVGTLMRDVFEACGGFKSEPGKVLYGGPMMGNAVPDLDQPVLKNTNAILAFDKKDAVTGEPTACIKCGRCIAHCPLGLMPAEIETSFRLGRWDLLEAFKVNLCMECGSCSYGCPANRPLVQTNRLAKAQLAAQKAARKEAGK